jgi:hypothetical protein
MSCVRRHRPALTRTFATLLVDDTPRLPRRRLFYRSFYRVSEGRRLEKENLMRGYVACKGDRWYAVVYEGLDPVTGKEKRSWHPARTTG